MNKQVINENEEVRDLQVLEALEEKPEVRQVDLASRLGLAVGTVNWLLKRLASKGHVKISRINKWQWRYILTPRGLTEKSRLTKRYIQISMQLYISTRQKARQLLRQVKNQGYESVVLDGDLENELIDVCKLTCLEQGIEIENSSGRFNHLPILQVEGRELKIIWPNKNILQ